MRRLFVAAVLAATAFSAPASAAPAGLVNGSFETAGTPTGRNLGGGLAEYRDGDDFGGWTVIGDLNLNPATSVLGINNAYGNAEGGITFAANEGLNHADLTGAGNTGANGVFQDIATTIGQDYLISFFLGNAQGDGTGNSAVYNLNSSILLDISGSTPAFSLVAPASILFTNSDTTPGFVNWKQFSQRFTATDTTTRITFTNATPMGDNFAGLDSVALSAVPEPSTWAMMILGLGFAGAALRRRRAVARAAFA